MILKYSLIFAICFLVGAAIAIGGRAVAHRPYAEGTEAHDMTAPAQAAPTPTSPAKTPGHEGHGSPAAPAATPAAPAPKASDAKPADNHQQHGGLTSPSAADPSAPIGNTVCPACGMDVDPQLAAIPTEHGLVGIGCAPCAPKIARDPGRYGPAARENRKAK